MQKEKREIFVSQRNSGESEKYCILFSVEFAQLRYKRWENHTLLRARPYSFQSI